MKRIITGIIILVLMYSCKNLPEIEDTPLGLQEIKDIGELITAEYYGEVIRSLTSVKDSDLRNEIQEDFEVFQQITAGIFEDSKNVAAAYRKFRREDYTGDYRFKRLVKISDMKNRGMFEFLLGEHRWDDFQQDYTRKINDYLERENDMRKGEIVYLGRGWVKAGFDLTSINFPDDFFYRSDTLYIFNLDPIILDNDINPWLVPGEISGFEIIKMEKKVSLEEIETVKRACKRGLKADAIESGIFNFAISSGQESLEALFTMIDLPGTEPVTTVRILPGKYFDYKIEYLADNTIDSIEFFTVQDLVNRDLESQYIDTVWFRTHSQQEASLVKFMDDLYRESFSSHNYNGWKQYYKTFKKEIRNTQ